MYREVKTAQFHEKLTTRRMIAGREALYNSVMRFLTGVSQA